MNAVYGLLGFLFFVSLPVVLRSIYQADAGLGVVFYSTAALLCLLRWREEKNALSWLLLAALSAGFAASTQANGLASAGLEPWTKLAPLDGDSWRRIAPPPRYFFTGPLSPLLLVFLPWAFKGKWLEEKKFLLGFALLYIVAALLFTDSPARFFLPVVPPLAALAVYGVFNAYLGIKQPAYLFAILFFFALLHGFYLWRFLAGGASLG